MTQYISVCSQPSLRKYNDIRCWCPKQSRPTPIYIFHKAHGQHRTKMYDINCFVLAQKFISEKIDRKTKV